ncbi:DUF4177 domain-containing protein [Sphingobacterium bovistauri]|uniref:DUF4177 domain-containing protein n=1 Tax=Sphingobacterium bovistauri TaxID=2781959 RepID=A0ABS7Z2P2_9SPHI|nr:DUF4177 domain-containing protein [Sphingobacterium bovistauri]MCA5004423.1 DUF4177 domain-containing protein [Sphingobacterium bovistauri]
MKRFEYKTIKIAPNSMWTTEIKVEDIEETLNDLGRQGWELVSVQDLSMSGTSFSYMYTFKRQTL